MAANFTPKLHVLEFLAHMVSFNVGSFHQNGSVAHQCLCLLQDARMSKSSRVPAHRIRTKEPRPAVKMAAVRAVADSTQERTNLQRKLTRIRKRKARDPDALDDSNLVSGSHIRRAGKASNKGGFLIEKYMLDKREPVLMGRQIPLTFTAQGKTQCAVTAAESSATLPVHTVTATDVDGDKEDSNVLMREWLERKADKGDLPGLQWHDKAHKLVRISWKHGSKSGWTASDSQVFISWARCTGREHRHHLFAPIMHML